MKLFVLLLCVLVAVVAERQDLDRPAMDPELIKRINSENGMWTAGVNEYFVGATLRDAMKLLGVLPGGPRLPEKNIVPLEDIPESFDPREEWGEQCPCLKHVRDQSNCGSCWAISVAEVITDRICIASKGESQDVISAQDVTSCCTSCGQGWNGGWPSAAMGYWEKTGVVTGGEYGDKDTCYPYALPMCDHHTKGKYPPCKGTGPTPNCARKCQPGYNVTWNDDKHKASNTYSVSSNVKKIQTELMTHGPVDAAFTVYDDFLTYKSGVYRHHSGSQLGGHAVKLIGWGTENGQDYWIVINSWNEDWGDNGQFKIVRGENHCGIEGQLCAGIPAL
jgi:cathepsin B